METGQLGHFRAAAWGPAWWEGSCCPAPHLLSLESVGVPHSLQGRVWGHWLVFCLKAASGTKPDPVLQSGFYSSTKPKPRFTPCSPDFSDSRHGTCPVTQAPWGTAPWPMCPGPGVFIESRLTAHCQGRPQGCPGSHPVSCPGRREHSLCSDSSNCLQIQEQTLGVSPLHVSPGLATLHSLLLLHRLLWLLDCPELSPLQLSLRMFCSSSHHRDLPWPT